METKSSITSTHGIILVIGVVLLLLALVVPTIPTRFSYGFFWSMMILFGVMHGVGDIDEIETLYQKKSKTTLIAIYSGLMIITALGRFLAPLITTIIFVIVGAYHFGNEHRDVYEIHTSLTPLHNTLRWACVLIPLIGFQRAYSSSLLTPILWTIEVSSTLIRWVYAIAVVARISMHGYLYSSKWVSIIATEVSLVAIIGLLAYTTNFYISFGFYFGIAHGLPQIITLSGSSLQNMKSQYLDLLTSYPVMILWTIGVWVVRYLLASYRFPSAELMIIFLMFLGILTIPHVLMEQFSHIIDSR
jgi:Brp/Blh family beta-carotene 15,15'-monooxygenase